MKISIIIPSYNKGKTLRRSIESVLNQNYKEFEIIVIDGGSNDGSIEILRSFKEKIFWISEPDKGQANAINKGLKLATGKIVKWLNADDILSKDSLFIAASFFRKNEKVDFVYGDISFIDINDKYLGQHKEPSFSPFIMLFGQNLFSDISTFWKLQAIKEVNFLDEKYKYSVDYELWLKLYFSGYKFSNIRCLLGSYRIERENISIHFKKEMRKEHFQILRNLSKEKNKPYYLFSDSLLKVLMLAARIYKKILVLFQRGDININIFKRAVRRN